MGKAVCFLIFGFGFLFCLIPSYGMAEPELKVTLTPSQKLRKGQPGQLHIKLKWKSSEGDYFFTRPNLELENLAIEEIGESNETLEEWKEKTFVYTLKAARIGSGKILPFRIGYAQNAQQKTDYLESGGFEIRILDDRQGLFRIIFTVLGLTLVIGTIFGLFFLRRSRISTKSTTVSEPSVEERYLPSFSGSIQPLEAAKLFRRYLREKYNLSQGGSTSLEILSQLEKKIQPDELKTLKKIFDRLDEYHFGNSTSSQTEHRNLYREMVRFVEGKKII